MGARVNERPEYVVVMESGRLLAMVKGPALEKQQRPGRLCGAKD